MAASYPASSSQPTAGPSTYASRSPTYLNGDSGANSRASPSTFQPVSPGASRVTVGQEGALGVQKGMKRRPRPLDLRGEGGAPRVDPELQEHLYDIASALTIVSDSSTLSDGLQVLTALRDTVHRNLRDRPVYSPHSGFATPSTPDTAPPDLEETDMTDVSELLDLLHSTPSLIIADTRPLGSYLDAHLPRSANLSIPSLILKRVRKGIDAKTDWAGMASFVTTPEGKEVWEGADLGNEGEGVRVVVLGSFGWDDTARGMLPILRGILPRGKVTLLRGGWEAIEAEGSFSGKIRGTKRANSGHTEQPITRPPAPLRSATLPLQQSRLPQTAPPIAPEPTFLLAPPTPPIDPVPRLANQISMPSLRSKRGQPTLSLNTQANGVGGKKPPSLSLNVERPLKSATTGSFPRSPTALRSPGLLKIDTTIARDPQLASTPHMSRFPAGGQSRMPSSPGSFGGSRPLDLAESDITESTNGHIYTEPETLPRTPILTARHAMSPFIVSTILPGFLYLGPEITNDEDVATLRRMGVKRILNVAKECEDESLGLKETFERYLKIPMRDAVEESGVGKGMRDSCDFLDDARLHDAPTYVHCRAGKSRSVTVVLAYLIHANAWTLKTAYAYVAERRKGISPNIGFVAELMQFEEAELGVKQSGGVHGESGSDTDRRSDDGSKGEGEGMSNGKGKGKSHSRYARESLPPAWSSSLGASQPNWISSFSGAENGEAGEIKEEKDGRKVDEREVRKNGQWVHQRRVPVDRSTLQPGRRASKAGLESLRTLSTLTGTQPSPSVGGRSETPDASGRLGWI